MAEQDLDHGYRGPLVCKIVGITYRQLDYWARTDLVRPSVCDANGSGTQRLYSYRDLVELKVIKRLLDADISLQAARKAIEYLREQLGADLASAHLVLDGGHTVLVQTGDQIVDLLRNGQGVLNIVSLGPVVNDLASELHDVEPDERVAVGRRRARRHASSRGRGARHRRRGAPSRVGALRAQLRAPVREAARLLQHRVGLRAAHVHARVGPRRPARAGVHARLLSARRTTSTSRSRR